MSRTVGSGESSDRAEGFEEQTATVSVTMTAYTDDLQPDWVAGYVTDVDGRQWIFHPVKEFYVSRQYLDADTAYPLVRATGCRVVEEKDWVTKVELLEVGLVERDENFPRIRVPSPVLITTRQRRSPASR